MSDERHFSIVLLDKDTSTGAGFCKYLLMWFRYSAH